MFTSLLQPILVDEWKKFNDGVPASRHGGTMLEEERSPRVQKELRIIEDLGPVLNQHRLVVAQAVIEQDYEETRARAAKGDDGSENAHLYSLFHQMTNLTREKDCLAHDDRIEVVGSVVGSFREELGVNPDELAASREEERVMEALEKLFDEAEDLQRLARQTAPVALSTRHAGGRRRAGW